MGIFQVGMEGIFPGGIFHGRKLSAEINFPWGIFCFGRFFTEGGVLSMCEIIRDEFAVWKIFQGRETDSQI